MEILTATATTIEIKGSLYAIEAIDAGECGVSAVRVTKLVNGESYDVIRTHANVVECTCPDFVCRHEGKGTMCKHGRAAVVGGFLPVAPAPVAGGSPVAEAPPAVVAPAPAFAPITAKDLVRARTWGLKLPAVAPESVLAIVPQPIAPVAEAAPEIATENPRATWPASVDADRWELGPGATAGAAPLAADDETAGPLPDGPRPSALGGHAPSIEDEAYHSGYALQFDHAIAANPPAGWRLMRSSAFRLGQADGLLARHRREEEELAEAAWRDERERDAFGDPLDRVHPCELVEFGGRGFRAPGCCS